MIPVGMAKAVLPENQIVDEIEALILDLDGIDNMIENGAGADLLGRPTLC